ncbi:zinc-binding dehydrogenase [Microbispora sp. NPDC049633]|uniref:quinone oxidoreductase family protein n=1 Tax=Microbispora sp. NPDC049633 TaxID=3154355 RepID=UPI00342EB146
MRALVMTGPSHGPDLTEVGDIPVPEPGEGEVSVDVSHAGVNFIDVMARRGDPGYVTAWPFVPGKEVAGTVRRVGPGVSGLVPGQRVAAFTPSGGLAEVAVAPAALAVPLPDDVPSRLAAAAPLMLTSALLLLTDAARLGAGENVLVHSASGGVGSAVARLAPALGGGRLVGTVGRPDKVEAARSAGYDTVIVRGEGAEAAIRDAVPGGVDVVLDPLGVELLELDLEVASPGGRIVLFGNAGGGEVPPLPPHPRLMRGNVGIVGFSVSALTATAPHRVARGLRRVLDLIAEGRLDVPVTEVGSLDGVPDVHQLLAGGRGAGKYVVRV